MQAYAGQNALERKLSMLETQQKEVHDALVGMEGEALRLYKVQFCDIPSPPPPPRCLHLPFCNNAALDLR